MISKFPYLRLIASLCDAIYAFSQAHGIISFPAAGQRQVKGNKKKNDAKNFVLASSSYYGKLSLTLIEIKIRYFFIKP